MSLWFRLVPSPGETTSHATFTGLTGEEATTNARANREFLEKMLDSI